MSAGVGGGDGGQEFELNLASIIDCFTVLIASCWPQHRS